MSTATATPTSTTHQRQPRRTPFWSAVGTVAAREMGVKATSKPFIITTLILLAAALAATLLVPRLGDLFAGDATSVAVVDQTAPSVQALGEDYAPQTVASADAAREAVLSGAADAAVVPDSGSPAGVSVLAMTDAPSGLVQALSTSPGVELLDPAAPNPALRYLMAFGFGLVFFMAAVTFGQQIAVSVIEEKQSRVVEILLAAVPAQAMMAGKVLGNAAMAILQVALLAGALLLGMQINGNVLPLDGMGVPILWFVMLFSIGFVMIAALYAAAASMVSRQEDIGSTSMPVMMLIMLPYFGVIFFNDNPEALRIMSWIPFSAPVAVPLRIFLDQGEWWEHIGSLVLLIVTTALAIWLAAVIYERSILRTGKALKWREALRG
ncbi:ABC transporter permease [Kocuria rhizophila]|uniref:ABC transporter permease n=1 Tax=Kocuria rhizophila TaxID=72000 RepID=UPI000C87CDBD|nr:ABC transporter permease [Kocuria rhizophila]MCT1957379.1 ABC transporter permease [Kocuria rhizophila]MCT2073389.1 ABC transporter permease [Kocuria rhizophila]MDR7374993.1 ABC-2 type transport system permease protein [Kocuria rhizophila]PMR91022.1 ABC transporter permease [Kocuria rhizophila]